MNNITKEELKELIKSVVNNNQAINGVLLTMKVMELINPTYFTHKEYMECLDELVKDKELVELEYILPEMEYRIKSIFFPKGTRIN